MPLKRSDTRLLVSLGAIYSACVMVLWLWIGTDATAASLVLLLLVLIGLQLHLFRRRERQDARQLRQIQALFTLYAMLPFRGPIPWLTGWAATPEFAVTLYQLVRERQPGNVLELGSGASSVIVAAALEQNGKGRLTSIEQDVGFAAETTRELERQEVGGRATVIHLPIVRNEIDGEEWLWYDRHGIPPMEAIDLLIVDGPNRAVQRMARYPALPILFPRLSDDVVIVLDDADRKDERAIVRRWLEQFGDLEVEYLTSPKGTAILHRVPRRASERRTASRFGRPGG